MMNLPFCKEILKNIDDCFFISCFFCTFVLIYEKAIV